MNNDVISRSALKKYMNDYRWEFCMRGDFAKAIEMVDCAPAVETEPKWISVKDRLPDVGVPVLVAYHNFVDGEVQGDGVAAQLYEPGCWYWWEGSVEDCDSEVRVAITHWMPLPDLPKEE